MLIAARIDLIERAAALLQADAHELRMAHTLPPHTDWPADEREARNAHDELVLTANSLRNLADEMRTEAELMERISGACHMPRRAVA